MQLEASVEFRIAGTFTDSLSRLTGEEQKQVKTTAFDRAMDKHFWSVHVDGDLWLTVHKTERHFLHLACTRPRDHLLVTSVALTSEFLDALASRQAMFTSQC